ncbi:hypothetical protein NE237_001260 [Protea cynaroides]|uniref:Uncharacterized protein n=1 Tax=Protea cynaroides TaxID=273540 RepID=A0A9Q0QY92_9MAGN|nr:hypothetical protein NE237_001260 [Protea cynaroides]
MAAANAPITRFGGGFLLVMDCGEDVGQMSFETPRSSGDPAIWSTEDDYGAWNGDTFADTSSNSNYDGRQTQTRSGSEPPNKKTRGDSQGNGLNRETVIDPKELGKCFSRQNFAANYIQGVALILLIAALLMVLKCFVSLLPRVLTLTFTR